MPHKEKRLKDAKAAAMEADFRVLRIMVGRHDTEGFASLHPRLRATRSARAFDLSGRAAALFNTDFHRYRILVLPRISTESGTDFHNIVLICAIFCDNLCFIVVVWRISG